MHTEAMETARRMANWEYWFVNNESRPNILQFGGLSNELQSNRADSSNQTSGGQDNQGNVSGDGGRGEL